jgi:hypothetical protein
VITGGIGDEHWNTFGHADRQRPVAGCELLSIDLGDDRIGDGWNLGSPAAGRDSHSGMRTVERLDREMYDGIDRFLDAT